MERLFEELGDDLLFRSSGVSPIHRNIHEKTASWSDADLAVNPVGIDFESLCDAEEIGVLERVD